MEISSKQKEAYFTATQMQLVTTRFFANRVANGSGLNSFVHDRH